MQDLDAIIIGGGISGLTVAHQLTKKKSSYLLLEKSSQVGGVIQTGSHENNRYELGPNSMAITPAIKKLIRELGLESDVLRANQTASKRYILINNIPEEITFKSLLFGSKILSFRSKLALFLERFRKKGNIQGESLGGMVRRRFNREILDVLVNPIVGGIFAGNPDNLEYKTAFQKLFDFEQRYGSLTKGFLKAQKKGGKREIISFEGGLSSLVNAIYSECEAFIHCYEEVTKVDYKEGHYLITSNDQIYCAKELYMTTPAFVTGKLIQQLDKKLSQQLYGIEYPPLVSISLSYGREAMKKKESTKGFGVLVPENENKAFLGAIYYTSIFGKDDAPLFQITLFLGGDRKTIAPNCIEENCTVAQNEVEEMLAITASPAFKNIHYWGNSIPQFKIGHEKILNAVDDLEQRYAGLHIGGNWRSGVAIGDCIDWGMYGAFKH